ncbi:MAG: GNAT family N-acetyltransferase [Ginsengibacter sp.]
MQTIMVGETIQGIISKIVMQGINEIIYWINRNFWGQGNATSALREFLTFENLRLIYGRVAFGNLGSQKVLE